MKRCDAASNTHIPFFSSTDGNNTHIIIVIIIVITSGVFFKEHKEVTSISYHDKRENDHVPKPPARFHVLRAYAI